METDEYKPRHTAASYVTLAFTKTLMSSVSRASECTVQ